MPHGPQGKFIATVLATHAGTAGLADVETSTAAMVPAKEGERRLCGAREVQGPRRHRGELPLLRRGLRVVRRDLQTMSTWLANGLDSVAARSDYNFAPDGADCIPVGPEPIPSGSCLRETDTFMGSSGFRLIPGNTCDVGRGIKKDASKSKPCRAGQATPGHITHQSVCCAPMQSAR